MSRLQNLAILGATGSIGLNTLDVAARYPQRFRIFALSANERMEELAELCLRHQPRYAVVAQAVQAEALGRRLQSRTTEILIGPQGLERVAAHAETDCVMAAIVGAAGLAPTLAAARAGKKLLLANKEALVMAGPIFMEAVRSHDAILLPIDSEHNAVFQCLPDAYSGDLGRHGVRRVLLTASGGPFREVPLERLNSVTPDEACAHPNWVMGRKISVDSATMMNKALEIIEAHWLFGATHEQIEVVVHPQSVVHSMVEYSDGSVIAQLGNPDMRTPIAHALAFPERIEAGVGSLDLTRIGRLDFSTPDFVRFPALRLGYRALKEGGTSPATLNAANEVAVSAFLERRLPFLAITAVIEAVMDELRPRALTSLDDVLDADAAARRHAALQVEAMTVKP
ncbi:MAG: 1-deoxy-D-xylulose-5-phosphate reductoisomerase [Burkholderiales bacterium]|nr:1-deoxy-D-xylulose-5-phosphate reductoisomerase [Burkholderiales bacterium]MCJ7838276.1 1-deoxy-D-xylulose-5-phosphate reductoisomerase [Burkholderiales bacterium]